MMSAQGFWGRINELLDRLEAAASADEVIAILNEYESRSAGDAFFAGSGGDRSVRESLDTAGWTLEWAEASYYWVMQAPDGSMVTYIEGDVYRGDVARKESAEPTR